MQRSLRALFFAVLSVCLTVAACGRATLDGYDFDGGLDGSVVDGARDSRADGDAGEGGRDGGSDGDSGFDGGRCGPGTCPNGCCDSANRCVTGNTLTSCGSGGLACEDCLSQGFDFCDAQRKTCARDVVSCNGATCADGCCRATAPRCLSGESSQACGDNGNTCAVCQPGEVCNPGTHKCEVASACGPDNCAGCCDDTGICRVGQDTGACGAKGQQCAPCPPGSFCGPVGQIGGICEGPPPCGPFTCPTGCCIGNFCVPGNQNTACGAGGFECSNCSVFGEVCNGQKCTIPPPQCNPQTCPTGCCNGTQCVTGSAQALCGTGGQACQNCTAQGRVCQNKACVSTCNAVTCPNGCCNGNTCLAGTSNGQCGTGGVLCQNCSQIGETCQNKVCQPPPCNAATCPNGCCNGNQCVTGSSNTLCGTGGVACQNCSAQGNVCSSQKQCIPPCGPGTCTGCCDTVGVCNAGFVNNKCGSGGANCANCVAAGNTCNITATPRACSNLPSNCPATVGACPGGVTTPVLNPQAACTGQLLADGRAACSAGPGSASCESYFDFLEASAPACGTCLAPFHHQFVDGTGLFNCVARFVGAPCRRNTGCATDCLTKSCSACPAGSKNQCENTVRQDQCSDEYQAAGCFTNGLSGAGSFCNPIDYQGNFGRWLEGVGSFYCLP